MAIFHKLIEGDIPAHKKALPVLSPMNGSVSTLDKVPQLLFKNRLLGEGVAITPSGYKVVSPFDGVIEAFPATKHQIRIKANNGIRMLIQVGIGSEQLMGEGFKSKLKAGDKISQGQQLLEFDLRKLKQLLPSVICPVTLLNSDKLLGIQVHQHQVIAGEDPAFTFYL